MISAKPTVYLETTVPSYLAAKAPRDLIAHAHQLITSQWWRSRRVQFSMFVSELVLLEAGRGDPAVAMRRLRLLTGLPVLPVTPDTVALAAVYVQELRLPPVAEADVMHVALATINAIDYLLTWNCRHIAQATIIRRLTAINNARGIPTPTICTPEELLYEN